MKSQDERVLAWLRHRGPLTHRIADDEMAITRLGACIHRLKKVHNIQARTIKVKNRYGQTCSVAEYHFLAEGQLL